MTVSKGREFLSIPGPTNVPDAVLAAMQRPAIDIYSGEMVGITDSCLADLRSLFKTSGKAYIYTYPSRESVASIKVPEKGLNSDLHAKADYRAHLITVMARRAVEAALR